MVTTNVEYASVPKDELGATMIYLILILKIQGPYAEMSFLTVPQLDEILFEATFKKIVRIAGP